VADLHDLDSAWVQNRGAACTTAAILAGLGALGATGLPTLEGATMALGAAEPLGAPGLLDYVSWPGRRAPLDLRIEALADAHGLVVRSRSGFRLPGWPLRPRAGEVLVAHLAWGQEAPGHQGSWGWYPLRPATYNIGGHSVVLAALDGRGWRVFDPNHPGLQHWPRPGLATAVTRIRRA
jgi:hypothetical protein